MLDFVLRYPIFYQYSSLIKRQVNALRVLHGFTDSVIHKRRRELLAMSINNNDNTGDGQKPTQSDESDVIGIRQKRAFLDLLLHSSVDGKPLTDLEIREEVDTFMFEVNSFQSFLSFSSQRAHFLGRRLCAILSHPIAFEMRSIHV